MSADLDKADAMLRDVLPLTIGGTAGALFTGACLTLGTICFSLLSSGTAGSSKEHRLLQIYVVILMLTVVGFYVVTFLVLNLPAVFRPHTIDVVERQGNKLSIALYIFQAIILYMTDGLLVWRCYTFQKALTRHYSSFRGKIYWAVPAVLWVLNFGIMTCAIPATAKIANPLQAALFILNALINTYGTIFIIIRLLQHRQVAKHCFQVGDRVPATKYHSTMGILLESAAINVPVAICTAVGNLASSSSSPWAIVFSIIGPSQRQNRLSTEAGRGGAGNGEEVRLSNLNDPENPGTQNFAYIKDSSIGRLLDAVQSGGLEMTYTELGIVTPT
ncbi:hypothetical protein P691DRAFT_818495 [Macrolepiota fuliginosa MF-IS2]|uniref:Uncharacterized protein n=1 Tax=Macrolepiota fuliginosa MF-IS2 TaxID=1400762 RepID=A0A9P5XC37_9AGAR|nr:hypothetical protein P691DRAFT_818495 [Macrolepiota fuliginosa MF-IS2]